MKRTIQRVVSSDGIEYRVAKLRGQEYALQVKTGKSYRTLAGGLTLEEALGELEMINPKGRIPILV